MKPLPFLIAVHAASLLAAHAEQQSAPLTAPTEGSEALTPEVLALFTPAEVVETTVTQQGGRDIIVQHLALDPNDPIEPVITQQAVAIPADSDVTPNSILHLTATVYPGTLTLLSWTHDLDDGTSRDFSGWSNIDFNHLRNISTIPGADDEQLSYIMAIGTEQIALESAPDFATETPTFIPNGAIPAEALVAIEALHSYYAVEGANLAAAHAEREQALLAAEEETATETLQDTESENQEEAEYEAEEEEAPPPPMDLIIRYRIAETPIPAAPAEGGAQ